MQYIGVNIHPTWRMLYLFRTDWKAHVHTVGILNFLQPGIMCDFQRWSDVARLAYTVDYTQEGDVLSCSPYLPSVML